MKGKPIIAGVLILALLAVCGLGIFSIWQGVRMAGTEGIRFDFGSGSSVEVTATEEKTLSVGGPVQLTVENDFGFVTVRPGTDGKVVITADKTGWAATEEKAQQRLAELKVVIEQDGDKIRVYLQRPQEVDVIRINPGGAQANFTVTVPVETSVDLTSQNGQLTLSGTQGSASLHSGFGNVDVRDLTGSLTIAASNGRLTVENIDASEAAINLESDFGDINADLVSGGDVTIKSTNGTVTLIGIEAAGKLDVRSDFGNLEVRSGSAESLDLHTSNGKVLVEQLGVNGSAIVSSDFGDLTMVDVLAADMDLQTQNGHISVSGARGTIRAESDFGEVDVSAENAVVTLISNNGDVTFTGDLGDGDHTLRSDFGDITLTIPADLALDLDLQTGMGRIKSDIPMFVSGEIDENHWSGTINGGGPKVTASTQNGNITIEVSK